jgi:DNA-binding XRE family transcriptional regulator
VTQRKKPGPPAEVTHYLREWRLHKKMSQVVLGKKAGAHGPAIARMEKKTYGLSFKWAVRLAAALEISVDQLAAPPEQAAIVIEQRLIEMERRILAAIEQSYDP